MRVEPQTIKAEWFLVLLLRSLTAELPYMPRASGPGVDTTRNRLFVYLSQFPRLSCWSGTEDYDSFRTFPCMSLRSQQSLALR